MSSSQPQPPVSAGLCSVTLRQLSAEAVIQAASRAGLGSIEWGDDVHVPKDIPAGPERLGAATRAAGLRVAAIGSYFRAGEHEDATLEADEWARLVAAARAMGAPRIRVWAGRRASADAGQAYRDRVAASLARCVDAAEGIVVATEFHSGTLTDDPKSARALLDAVPGLGTYWQPPNGMPTAQALDGLDELIDHVVALHVFSWWPGPDDRRLLAFRDDLWSDVFARLRARAMTVDCLLEFLPGDDPELLAHEASALIDYLTPAD